MTLIVSWLAEGLITQCSDRRLTNIKGEVFDDQTNKVTVVRFAESLFTVAFTGMAFFGPCLNSEPEFMRAQRHPDTRLFCPTSFWLTNKLLQALDNTQDLDAILEYVKSEAQRTLMTKEVRCIPKDYRRLLFVAAGFQSSIPTAWTISNCSADGEEYGEFRISKSTAKKPTLLINGAHTDLAVISAEYAERVRILRQKVRKQNWSNKSEGSTIRTLTDFIRFAGSVSTRVGSNVMGILVYNRKILPCRHSYLPLNPKDNTILAPDILVPGLATHGFKAEGHTSGLALSTANATSMNLDLRDSPQRFNKITAFN